MVFKPHFPERLNLDNKSYRDFLRSYLKLVLESDDFSDNLSSRLAGEGSGRAVLTAKSDGVFAGVDEISFLINEFTDLEIEFFVSDSDRFRSGDDLLVLCGTKSTILSVERVLINFLSRLCGIASKSADFSDQISCFENKVLFLLTRKTLLSYIDKKAGVLGGGLTHRLMLSDSVIIKENHIVSNPLDTLLSSLTSADLKGADFVEIEVENENEAREVLSFFRNKDVGVPTGIMFDNFEPSELKSLLARLDSEGLIGDTFTEASGGICLDNLEEYDMPYLDYVSSGDITMNPYAIDLSLNLERK